MEASRPRFCTGAPCLRVERASPLRHRAVVPTQAEDRQQAEERSKRQEENKPKLDEWGQPIQEGLKPVSEVSNNDKFYRQLVCGGVAGSVTSQNHLMGDGGELEFNSKDDRGKRQLLRLQY